MMADTGGQEFPSGGVPTARGPSGRDRRRDLRTGFVAPAMLDSQRAWDTSRSANISEHGMLVRSTMPLAKGQVVDVYFELPSGRSVQTSAVVVNNEIGRAHLHFPVLSASDELALRYFVRSRRAGRRTALSSHAF